MNTENLYIGTCSWKYDSWENLVYSVKKPSNYLQEYARQFRTVEVDQWFWSLFPGSKVVLPKPSVVREYSESVPSNFRFCIKVPNSITLTHYYKKAKSDPLAANPYFLSSELMLQFLDVLQPLHPHLGPLIFQFEYLNKQKMAGAGAFIDQIGRFIAKLPKDFMYCVESRNPNYLNRTYFNALKSLNLHHVFLHGYFMPSIFDVYKEHREQIGSAVVIRLHGPDRNEIEKQVGDDWSRIVAPKDQDIAMLAQMLEDLRQRNVQPFIYVNNHFEGSAPRTIARIFQSLV
jgi:uncharacterized protein YecE (DUF72 family)